MGTTPIETVKKIYEAFARGDIPQILEQLSEDVVWEYGKIDNGVPWLRPGQGKKAAVDFFTSLHGMEITRFEVNDVVGNDHVVVGLINFDFTVKSTGKKVEERDEAHIWRFDAKGRVVRFRHAPDTLAQAQAVT